MSAPNATDRTDRLPLSEPVFHILLALLDEPLHGYGIMTRVEAWTAGRIRLRTATLYTALARLREAGVIDETEAEEGGDVRRGRIYRLTSEGMAVVRAERSRLQAMVHLANLVAGPEKS
jgi:DNA-binding PadR family transcriptional regulator